MNESVRRRGFAAVTVVAALVLTGSGRNSVDALHSSAVVWDSHNDLVYRVEYEGLDIGERLPAGHVDIPRLQEGGVDVQTVGLYVPNFLYTEYPGASPRHARRLIHTMREAIEANPDAVELARTGSDVDKIVGSGKIAMPLTIEGGHAIEDRLELLEEFHGLGVSGMSLTHNVSHDWADAGVDEPRWGGLNTLGEKVVREMNRLGMIIDVSHASDEAFFDALRVSSQPVIATHSGCRSVSPHLRNMSDEMLQALGKNGGVIGIIFVLNRLTPEYNRLFVELRAISRPWYEKVPKIEDVELRIALGHLYQPLDRPLENIPTIEDVLDHIDHAVKVAGVDHVGLGADMYARCASPVGIRGVEDYPAITRGLKRRGYSDEAIRKVMGGNFLRVWKQVTG